MEACEEMREFWRVGECGRVEGVEGFGVGVGWERLWWGGAGGLGRVISIIKINIFMSYFKTITVNAKSTMNKKRKFQPKADPKLG